MPTLQEKLILGIGLGVGVGCTPLLLAAVGGLALMVHRAASHAVSDVGIHVSKA